MSGFNYSKWYSLWSDCMMNLQFIVQNGASFPKTDVRYERIVKGTPSEWCTDEFLVVTKVIKNPDFKIRRVELATEVDNITFVDDAGNLLEVVPDIHDLFYLCRFIDTVKEAEAKANAYEIDEERLELAHKAKLEFWARKNEEKANSTS